MCILDQFSPPKMTPKLIQNESKIFRNCPPGPPWSALGAFQSPWSPPGALQEPPGTLRRPILEPPGTILESPGDHFRPPGVHFGLILNLRDHLEAFGELLKTLGTILRPRETFCSVQGLILRSHYRPSDWLKFWGSHYRASWVLGILGISLSFSGCKITVSSDLTIVNPPTLQVS